MININEWKWFGNAGHFICGRWCRFHLCTRVGKYLVSTVGMYIHPSDSLGENNAQEWLNNNPNGREIGYNRFYETMVFLAGAPCGSDSCNCGQPTINGTELDFSGYRDAGSATDGHIRMCMKWATKGGLFQNENDEKPEQKTERITNN